MKIRDNNFPTQPKFEELEGLRGLAAILVVIFHLPAWNSILDVGFIRNSYLMVDLFFVLSGFIICKTYDNINSLKGFVRFQFLRAGRLYPVHIVILLAYMALEIIRYLAVTEWNAKVDSEPLKEGIFLTFLQHIFLVHAIMGGSDSFNIPSWSISIEFYTYMLFGVVSLGFGSKYKKHIFFLIFITSFTLLICKSNTFSYHGSDAVLRCLTGFFAGCITSYAMGRTTYRFPSYIPALAFSAIIIFLTIKPSGEQYDSITYLISAILIYTLASSQQSSLHRVLRSKYMLFLGMISYSIYMTHYILIRFFDIALRRFFALPTHEVNGAIVVDLNIEQTLVTSAALLSTTVFVSYGVYKLIETPFRERSRRFAYSVLSNGEK
jgi:peptidoglycan/LPS O-acetylase OafA/YrhL